MKYIALALLVAGHYCFALATLQDTEGIVVIEAENTQSPLGNWIKKTEIPGYTGTGYLDFTGNDYLLGPPDSKLEYGFTVNKAGLYYLHLRCARESRNMDGEIRNDVANDCYVRVVGDFGAGPNAGDSHGKDAPLSLLRKDTKFFGGADNQFAWAFGPDFGGRLDPGGHKNKRVATYNFKEGETYTLVVHGRSRGFKMDRIVFARVDLDPAHVQNLDRKETLPTAMAPRFAYSAIEDFDNLEGGDVPFYVDNRNDALAIDARIVANRNRFARASRVFHGESGSYQARITTLTEEDGESTFHLLVDENIVGTYRNSHIGAGSPRDLKPEQHTWKNIQINHGASLAVESTTHTNGEIPEGDGTAWARGRWRLLELTENPSESHQP